MIETNPSSIQKAVELARRCEERSRSPFSGPIKRLQRFHLLGPFLRKLVVNMEGGKLYTRTLREILEEEHGVKVGKYSYGPCLKPGFLPRGTVVGNFCSFSGEILILRRNHPTDWLSQHPFFYNRHCGFIEADAIPAVEDNPLTVGHDVWIGARTIILPKCKTIGDGAIVGAGSILTRDVPPFAIVAGNPARVIGSRFSPEVIAAIRETQWWLKPLPELIENLPLFLQSIPEAGVDLLRCLQGKR
ncbi:MAG TPA: CatB-related O-acetyltransferase [Lacunisphaera sp.]|nr:CatB-related O-acetyltransferase [Lacunisphaera sp.]